MKLVRFLLLSILFFNISCGDKVKGRFTEIIEINNVTLDYAFVKVEFNIKTLENTNAGICWSTIGTPIADQDDNITRFYFNDLIDTFSLNGLFSNQAYYIRSFINTGKEGTKKYLYSDVVSFKTSEIPEVPCQTGTDIVSFNNVDYYMDNLSFPNYDDIPYHVSVSIPNGKLNFIFKEYPLGGVYETTKSIDYLNDKQLRIEGEFGAFCYLQADSNQKVYIDFVNGKISISFCNIVYKDVDSYCNQSYIINGNLICN